MARAGSGLARTGRSGRRAAAALGILAVLVSPAALPAQDDGVVEPPLVTDRPTFTAAATVVPRGALQLETGLTWQSADGGVDVLSGPEALVRWGATRRLELRLGLPDYVETGGGGPSGFGDASLGVKLQLGPIDDWDLALIGALSVLTGDEPFTGEDPEATLIFTAGRALAGSWSLGTQISATGQTVGGDESIEWGTAVVLGRPLGASLGGFLELAGTFPDRGSAAWVFHTGLTRGLGPLLQVDLRAGAGLSDPAPDLFVGVGLALRR